MECIRGFSNTFMPENKIETLDLQYIEGGELEKAWKHTRRQRLKEQEQRIWEEFTKEKDILSTVLNDDPYQFIEDLPEIHVQESIERTREAKRQQSEELQKEQEVSGCESPTLDRSLGTTCATSHEDDSGIFHIYSDDKESDQEDKDDEDLMNESTESPPHTVRERSPEKDEIIEQNDMVVVENKERNNDKSTENIANIIESSIYCARVKELRKRIITEINSIIGTLDTQAIFQLEPTEIRRMTKRSAEFCGRFQRIHLYQLHRQMYDIKRHNASATPFAKHTQFQSQMVRVVSLHQNMLQAFQVFHKYQSSSICLREGVKLCGELSAAVRGGSALCRAEALPHCAVNALYDDVLEETCEKLDDSFKLYEERIVNYIGPMESSRSTTRRSVRSKANDNKNKGLKKRVGPWVKPSKSSADSRLSMYSLDTIRLNLASCPSSKEPPSSSTSRVRNVASPPVKLNVDVKNSLPACKTTKKSPTSRRPLMRDPQQGKPRRSRVKDSDIKTMVEVVEAQSSHVSIGNSPRTELTNLYHSMKAPPSKISPRRNRVTPNSAGNDSDRRTKPEQSPKEKYVITDVTDEQTLKEVPVPKLELIQKERSQEESPKRSTKKEHVSGKQNVSPRTVNPQTGCEVTRLLRQLCGNTGGQNKNERSTGAKNVQLVSINGSSPRQPSTPQLLRILEETIQKKAPRPMYATPRFQDVDRFRLTFNIPDRTCDNLLKYRTKFVQHMLSSSMYANGAVGKPWKVIDGISSEIIDEVLAEIVSEMEISEVLKEMLKCETSAV